MLSAWSKDDLTKLKILEELLLQKASWSGSTADMIKLHQSLVWFSSLKQKIEDSQVEIVAVRNNTPPVEKERIPGKKATRDARAAAAAAAKV